jgi:hypothetical protein
MYSLVLFFSKKLYNYNYYMVYNNISMFVAAVDDAIFVLCVLI